MHISIDTIKFKIPCVFPNGFMQDLDDFIPAFEGYFNNHYQSSQKISTRKQLVFKNDLDKSSYPSHTTPLLFKPMPDDGGDSIWFEFSIPKVVLGHNGLLFWDWYPFLKSFEKFLRKNFSFDISNVDDWVLKRVDVNLAFLLESEQQVKDLEKRLSMCLHRGKESKRPGVIAHWSTGVTTYKFYAKGEEMQKRRNGRPQYSSEFLALFSNYFNHILRYEEEWKQKRLQKMMNVKYTDMCTVRRFKKWVENNYSYEKHLEAMIMKFSLRQRKIHISESIKVIEKECRKPRPYIDYIIDIADFGLAAARENLGCRKKRSRYDKRLRKLGIDPTLIHGEFYAPHLKDVCEEFNLSMETITNHPGEGINIMCEQHDPVKKRFQQMFKGFTENAQCV